MPPHPSAPLPLVLVPSGRHERRRAPDAAGARPDRRVRGDRWSAPRAVLLAALALAPALAGGAERTTAPADGAPRRASLGTAPTTWFAGPDTVLLDARFGWSGGARSVAVDWNAPPDLSGTGLGCDSLTVRPGARPAHKTFFELYRDRLYLRTEGDTVHMNSWVIVHGGGSDPDSPYRVSIGPGAAALDDTLACAASGVPEVVRDAGPVGSASGFRTFFEVVPSFGSLVLTLPGSRPYPDFDPVSTGYQPWVSGYVPMHFSGKVYLHLRARDGDGAEDASVVNAREIADRVDAGIGTPEEIALRDRILTFHVNHAPRLLLDDPGFTPRPHQAFGSRTLHLELLAADDDPFDPDDRPPSAGGPSAAGVLRWNVVLRGRDAGGTPQSVTPLAEPALAPSIDVQVPESLADSLVTVEVEVCDCDACEQQTGTGRCATYAIPIRVPPAVSTATLASLASLQATPASVRLRWRLSGASAARVERRTEESGWRAVGEVVADGVGDAVFEDRAVAPGRRYGYRLVVRDGDHDVETGEVWAAVPATPGFALRGVSPNPSAGDALTLRFALPDAAPARLTIADVAGRVVERRDLGVPGAGEHALRVRPARRLDPGVYLLRLEQGKGSRTARAIVIE
jgi:hypothetical protein